MIVPVVSVVVLIFVSVVPRAYAVPAFAQQTGQPCTTCHIGSFGPQLTPFGRAFKIGGYTQTGGEELPKFGQGLTLPFRRPSYRATIS